MTQVYRNAVGPKGSISEATRELVNFAARPEGVTNAEITQFNGKPNEWVSGRMSALVTNGHVIRTRKPGYKVRFFTSQAHADAWMQKKDAPGRSKSSVILEMAGSKDGVGNQEIQRALELEHLVVSSLLTKLLERKKIASVKRQGWTVRYFLSRADADAWMYRLDNSGDLSKPEKISRTLAVTARKKLKSAARAGEILSVPSNFTRRDAPAPVDIKHRSAAGPVSYAAGFKFTRLETLKYDTRYQVDPSTRVVGGFSTLGPGRYLEHA